MGDGRYYTIEQFYSVVFTLGLIIFLIISLMSSFYRTTKNRGSKYITVVFSYLGVIAVLMFIEEIYLIEATAKMLRYTQCIILSTVLITFAYYLSKYVIPIYNSSSDEIQNKSDKFFIVSALSYLLGMFIIGLYTNGELLIKEYSFHHVVYTDLYKVIILLNVILLSVVVRRIFVLVPRRIVEEVSIYKSKILAVSILIFSIIPLAFYIVSMFQNEKPMTVIEYGLIFLLSILFKMLVISFVPYYVTPLIFDSINDVISDYIFIIDDLDEVIYTNVLPENEYIHNDVTNINAENTKLLFKGTLSLQTEFYKEPYVMLTFGEEDRYFTTKTKKMKNDGNDIGQIITITDITELIGMLIFLEKKKIEAEVINQELNDYADIVFYLEQEKEVNALLEEIILIQADQVNKIIFHLNNSIKQNNNEITENDIDKMLKLANGNLDQIRSAVSAYKEHYGGVK